MTSGAGLRDRIALLDEIATIMESIRTIAVIEAQHSRNWLQSQQQGMASLSTTVAEFLSNYFSGQLQWPLPARVTLVIGSERGFCGDFNSRLTELLDDDSTTARQLVLVGFRLNSKIPDSTRIHARVAGANVAAELEDTLASVLEALATAPGGFAETEVMYHDPEYHDVKVEALLHDFATEASEAIAEPGVAVPPIIQLPPSQLLAEISSQYVYARLNLLLTRSLCSENERRIAHLGGAVQRMREQREQLTREQNQQRQEQITEELEIILLNAETNTQVAPERN